MFRTDGFIRETVASRLFYDANTSQGVSGAPLMANGAVVGVHTHGHDRTLFTRIDTRKTLELWECGDAG